MDGRSVYYLAKAVSWGCIIPECVVGLLFDWMIDLMFSCG